jgi:hypothetical protein
MSRLTKNISLVLVSSSMILPGCERRPLADATCDRPRPGMQQAAEAPGPVDANRIPPACGPVDNRQAGHGGHPHVFPYVGHYSRGYSGAAPSGATQGGRSAAVSRGGFGTTSHGVAS